MTGTPRFTVMPTSVEFTLVLLSILISIGWPRLGCSFFLPIERALGRLARNRGLAVVTVGLTGLLLRIAILPFCPEIGRAHV